MRTSVVRCRAVCVIAPDGTTTSLEGRGRYYVDLPKPWSLARYVSPQVTVITRCRLVDRARNGHAARGRAYRMKPRRPGAHRHPVGYALRGVTVHCS
jgi:hypothetical protein